MTSPLLAAGESNRNFVQLDVELWHWAVLLALIVVLLLVDLFVFHKEAHEVKTREAVIESCIWISCGIALPWRAAIAALIEMATRPGDWP